MRGYKHPLAALRAEEVLEQGLLMGNSGNLIFSEAAYRTLATEQAQVTVSDFRGLVDQAERINEEYDHVVLPFANAFRPEFVTALERFTRLVRRLRIPVTVLGIGAQSDVDYGHEALTPLRGPITDFVAAVLDRAPSIGVRGHFTEGFLRSLGFDDVEVIGCPSIFMSGARLPEPRSPAAVDADSRIALSLTPGVHHPGLLDHHLDRYRRLVYIPQSQDDLRLMLWGAAGHRKGSADQYPRVLEDRVFAEDRARFFVDASTWIRYLGGVDFAFGTRIHGNVAALLAGTPAHVLAHDSRTRELAEYLEIPHTRVDRLGGVPDAAELARRSDPSPFFSGHARRFAAYDRFLGRHGLPHAFSGRAGPVDLDRRLADTALPGPVRPLSSASAAETVQRVRWLEERRRRDRRIHQRRVARLRRTVRRLQRDRTRPPDASRGAPRPRTRVARLKDWIAR